MLPLTECVWDFQNNIAPKFLKLKMRKGFRNLGAIVLWQAMIKFVEAVEIM